MADQDQSDAQLDDSIQDVSLLDNTAPSTGQDQQTDTSGDTTANEGADEAADTQSKSEQDQAKNDADAKSTEAKDNNGDDSQASDNQNQEDQNGEQQQQPSKEERDQAARQAWNERQRNRNEVANQLDQFYGPKTKEQLVEEGMDPGDANYEALRQEMAYSQERTRVAELNASMRAEAVEVYHDFPVFDPKSDQFDEQFAKQVEQQYKTASRIQTDENGIVLSADVSLYQFYEQMNDIYSRGTSRGAQQKQSAVEAMQSRTENPGGSSSTAGPAPGSLEEFEQKYGDVVIT